MLKKIQKIAAKLKQEKCTIIILLMILGSIIPYCVAAAYTFYVTDDYAHALALAHLKENAGYLTACSQFAADKWLHWQGTYFSMFLQAFLSPLNGAGIVQLKVIAVGNVLALFASMFFVLKEGIVYWKGRENAVRHAIMGLALIAIPFLNFEMYYEVYFWYSGMVSYTIPMTLLFCGTGCTFLYLEKQQKRYCVAACICMICVGGGTLGIAGAGCWTLLGILALDWWKNKKINKEILVIFLCGFLGSLCNAAAPGNYIRQTTYHTDGLHFVKAVKDTVVCILNCAERKIMGVPFMGALVLAFAGGQNAAGKVRFKLKEQQAVILWCVLLPLVSEFPMALAYGDSWLVNRAAFVVDFFLMTGLLGIALTLGTIIGTRQREETKAFNKAILPLWVALAFCVVVVRGWGRDDWKAYNTYLNLENGVIPDYSHACIEIYDTISQAGEKEIIEVAVPEPIEDYMEIFLPPEEDPVNEWLAEWYGVKKVRAKADAEE